MFPTEDFEYSAGALAGKNGGSGFSGAWSGGSWAVVTSDFFSGSACCEGAGTNSNTVRDLSTPFASGDIYVAAKAVSASSNDQDNGIYFGIIGVGTFCGVRIQNPGGTLQIGVSNGGSFTNIIPSPSYGTWYVFHFVKINSTQFKVRYWTGTDWSSFSSDITSAITGSIDRVQLNQSNGQTVRFDTLQPTSPFAPPVVYGISGVVSLSGTPVEGAVVRCIRQSDNVALAEQITDESGAYLFEDLEDGELYHLAVEYEAGEEKYNALSLWDVAPVELE